MRKLIATLSLGATLLTGCYTLHIKPDTPEIIKQAKRSGEPIEFMHKAYRLQEQKILEQERSLTYLRNNLNQNFRERDSLRLVNHELTRMNTGLDRKLRRTMHEEEQVQQQYEQQITNTRQANNSLLDKMQELNDTKLRFRWYKQRTEREQNQLRDQLRGCVQQLAGSSVPTNVLMYHDGTRLIQFPGYEQTCDAQANTCINVADLP